MNQQGGPALIISGAPAAATAAVNAVNRSIQQLAMKYSRDCRLAFEELSKIVQKVMACQDELTHYDAQQNQFADVSNFDKKPSLASAGPGTLMKSGGIGANCYGCLLASVELCILMLRALTATSALKRQVIEKIADSNGLLQELYEHNLRFGPKRSRRRIRDLLVNLMRNSPKLTWMLNSMIFERVECALGDQKSPMAGLGRLVQPDMDLLQASIRLSDDCWELRIQCIFRLFSDSLHIRRADVYEAITLPCVETLQMIAFDFFQPTAAKKKSAINQISNFNFKFWLDHETTFNDWKNRRNRKILPKSATERKSVIHEQFLMTKYGKRWLKNSIHKGLNSLNKFLKICCRFLRF